jgi:hypothetical protein
MHSSPRECEGDECSSAGREQRRRNPASISHWPPVRAIPSRGLFDGVAAAVTLPGLIAGPGVSNRCA